MRTLKRRIDINLRREERTVKMMKILININQNRKRRKEAVIVMMKTLISLRIKRRERVMIVMMKMRILISQRLSLKRREKVVIVMILTMKLLIRSVEKEEIKVRIQTMAKTIAKEPKRIRKESNLQIVTKSLAKIATIKVEKITMVKLSIFVIFMVLFNS